MCGNNLAACSIMPQPWVRLACSNQVRHELIRTGDAGPRTLRRMESRLFARLSSFSVTSAETVHRTVDGASLMPSTGPTLLTRPSAGPTLLTRPSTGPTLLTRPSTGPTLVTEEPSGGPMRTSLVTGVEATRPACAWDTKPGAKPAAKVSAMSPIPVILDSLSISPSYVCLCLPGDVREGRDNGLQLSGCQDPS